MKHIAIFCLLSICFSTGLSSQDLPRTKAETSQYASTSRYTDVMAFIKKLEGMSPFIRTETLATSGEERDIPLMVLANPMPAGPEQLARDPRLVVYIQANIHAGEVEGKEASLMFARDILQQKDPELLRNTIILICPIFNPDGNEKISTENRTNQVGPVNGVGVRHNAWYLDLNRDAMKVESPEIRGVITNVLNRWDPAVMIDMHTTNGVYRQEPVTFSWMINPNGSRELIHYMRDKMMPAMSRTLDKTYGVQNTFYGEFIDMADPMKGYIAYASEPRYFVNYVGLRNRLAILNENYVYADFETRVTGSHALLHSMLDYVSAHGEEIRNLLKQADDQTTSRGLDPSPADSFALRYAPVPTPEKLLVRTYQVERYTDENGRPRYRKTDEKLDLKVPYIADYVATRSIRFPFAYLLTIPDPKVLDNLRTHGIRLEQLSRDEELEVERFDISKLEPSPRLNQGHYNDQVEGSYTQETRTFEKGTYLVRTAQPLANLAVYLLEPETDDGLLFWNFFDRYLVPQWGRGYFPYPVYRVVERTDIPSVPAGR